MSVKICFIVLVSCLAACGSTPSSGDGEYQRGGRFLENEIRDRIDAFKYQNGPSLLDSQRRLAYIGEPSIPHLLDGLRNESPMTRASSAYVLGLIRDIRTVDELVAVTESDTVSTVRYQAASALVNIGAMEGYAVLVSGLNDPEIRNRYKCFEVLNDVTKLDFGYSHDADEASRSSAVTKWEQWVAARNG